MQFKAIHLGAVVSKAYGFSTNTHGTRNPTLPPSLYWYVSNLVTSSIFV